MAGRHAADVRILRARCVLLAPGCEMAPGEVVIDRGGRIQALRRPTSGRIADVCILPGLVDAHVHLQIRPVAAPRSFLPWVGAVMAARAAETPAGQRRAARAALASLVRSGVTAVGEIDSTGESPGVLAASGIRGRCYRELTGFHLDGPAARALVRERWRAAPVERGLSPHAPYSVSEALFRAAAKVTRHLAVHCAELAEEQEFLHTGRGPFADLLQRLGRLPAGFRPPGRGAVAWLDHLGLLRKGTQLVHCQELENGDAERIRAAGASIAVCPGTIAWFGRQAPPVPKWLALGIPVALGTDSPASSDEFSMRSELRLAAARWPELSPAELFAMATVAGGASLGRPGLGRLRVGGRADLLVVPALADRAADHLAAFVHDELTLLGVWVAGRRAAARR